MGVSCTKKYSKPRWLRALALHPHPVLFADVEPADACQGRVGNCWLIAAISALAEFPAYLKGSVFVTRKVSKTGKYAIKLYDGRHYRWRCIEVDDYLPCTYFGAGYTPSLYFGKINNGKLCFALLEKAFAKLYGSYSALRGGYQPVAWHHLTGVKEFFHYQSQYAVSVRWEVSCAGIPVYADRRRSQKLGVMAEGARFFEKQRVGAWIKFQKLSGDGPGEGWLMYYSRGQRLAFRNPSAALRFKAFKVNINPSQIMEAIGGDEGKKGKGARACFTYKWSRYFSPDEMWDQLVSFDKGNYLMACTATYCKDESDCGMVHRHAYSILHAVEIDGFKLVACRNPWGNDKEWNGPWSDRSNEWKYHPKIAKALHVDFQTEGIFWMDWEDWQYIMGQFKAMNCKMPSARGGFHTDFVDEDEDGDGEDGGDFVDEDDEDDVELTGEVVGCEGLCEEWTQPTLMDEGVALKPGESATFKNVPFYLKGKTYFGIKGEASAGMWTIEYVPPVPMYVWLMVGSTNSVELVLPTQGWTQEPAEGFQSSDGYELIVLSYTFTEGKYFSIRCTAPIVGGLVGGHAPPKLPTPGSNEANEAGGDGPAVNLGKVLACSGLDIAWNPPKTMTEGTLTNPGQRNYIFEHVPACLSGGTYIGSQTWPSAGTWTIEYEAPTTLYVWVEKGEYNAGVDDVLGADGWHREEVGDFQRNNCNGGVNPLGLWSRHFDSGSSYSIETTGTFVGGVVSECVDD
ncbi:unnamed protein product [Effrenium voratum]|nr:unnamed protein product [Effrenium voratum]